MASSGVQARHHGPDRNTQQPRDLLVLQSFKLLEHQDLAFGGLELGDALLNAAPDLGPLGRALWIVGGGAPAGFLGEPFGVLAKPVTSRPAVAVVVEAQSTQDLVVPGVERKLGVDSVSSAKRSGEGLLGQVESILVAADQAQRRVVGPTHVDPDQFAERLPLTRLGTKQQLAVAYGDRAVQRQLHRVFLISDMGIPATADSIQFRPFRARFGSDCPEGGRPSTIPSSSGVPPCSGNPATV